MNKFILKYYIGIGTMIYLVLPIAIFLKNFEGCVK